MGDGDLVDIFVQEAREHLDNLEPDLLSLEGGNEDPEIINRIFRAVHSIKGTSGFVGLKTITSLSHVMENVMSLVREGTLAPTKIMIDALLSGTDKLRVMVDDIEHSGEMDIEAEVSTLKAILDGDPPAASPSSLGEASAPAQPPVAQVVTQTIPRDDRPEILREFEGLTPQAFRDAVRLSRKLFIARVYTHKDMIDKGQTPLHFFKKIETVGEFIDSYTDISCITGLDDEALDQDLRCVFLCSSILEVDLLSLSLEIPDTQIQQLDDKEIQSWLERHPEVEPSTAGQPAAPEPAPSPSPEPLPAISAPPPEPASAPAAPQPTPATEVKAAIPEQTKALAPVAQQAPVPAASAPAASPADKKTVRQKTEETIRISVSLVDDLMNLAGEMVLGRNQLLRLAETASAQIPGMAAVLQNVSHVTSDLQEKVMRTRLQPIGSIFGKFTRIIRDLSHQLGKEIDLKTSGEDVELDRSIIEALSDPLTHIIRNCCDHAIEPPAERQAANKPRRGLVRLTAEHVGGQVLIEIVDDGRGLNPEKLKSKAIEKGVISAQEAEKLSDRQAMSLIFAPGFSTAAQVSDVSGRGVGMDVVKTNIEKLGGSVELDSEMGRGTRIALRLPLTLAIVPAMIVGASHRRFAVPQVNLDEIVMLNDSRQVETVRGTQVLRLRDKLLPLVDLHEALDMPHLRTQTKETSSTSTDASVSAEGEKKKASSSPAQKSFTTGEDSEGMDSGGFVLVLRANNNRFGLIVSELHDSEEIVVKPLSTYLKSSRCYSGATIMGDGKVAMILDTGGLASLANLEFSEDKKQEELDTSLDYADVEGESQSILLFENAGKEVFAINLAMVARIEKIQSKDIEYIGSKQYLKYRNSSLQLVRLHDYMPVSHPSDDPEHLHIIVPKLVRKPMGIVATRVVDAIQTSVSLDNDNVSGTGILGSAVIQEKLTLFVDVYSLFEAVDPEHYSMAVGGADLSSQKILLAEDTPFFRSVEIQYLKELVGQVDAVVNGLEAWERLNSEHYDMLLTDIEMPVMDGFELIEKVRSSSSLSHLPIVALTSLSADHHIQKGESLGVDAWETKLDKERLRGTLERILLHSKKGGGAPARAASSHLIEA